MIGFINEEYRLIAWTISFILKSGFNTPQLAVADFKPQKSEIFDGSQKFFGISDETENSVC